MRPRRATRRLRRALLLGVAAAAAGLALLLDAGDILERAELDTVDARFSIRGERAPPERLLVVGIDAKSFETLQERFPFSRRRFARALDRIAAGDPALVVYDVQFTEPSGDSREDIAADNALLEAVRRAGNVVLSSTEVAADGTTNVFGGVEAQQYARATVGNGLLPEGPAGTLRHVPYEIDGLRTLAVAAAERLGRPVDRSAMDGEGAWIDYAGPPGHLRTVSFGDVVVGRVPPATFRDRIVVIGASAPSLQDRHPTSWPGGEMAGPEIHANALDTVLRGAPLRSTSRLADVLLTIVLSVLAPLAGLKLRPFAALALALAAAVAYAVVAQLLFGGGRVLPLTYPLAGLGAGLVGSLAVHYLTASVERQQVRDLFARFVPDSVVSEVLARADREDPRLGGVRLMSTVMFSDLRGFTSFAEEREPEEVIEVLNRYLSLMSDAILDHGGTLVAYMGDGIMAVFGAPLAAGDHADRALAAAREMLGRLDEFNAWMRANGHGDGFRMGIGLNTGSVMSGNVGSERRLEYTAIGDTTNTAARLEAMTKGTPYQLFVAGPTHDALREKPEDLEFVDHVDVRGRRGRLPVWGLAAGGGTVRDA